jgi:hypothetical protein
MSPVLSKRILMEMREHFSGNARWVECPPGERRWLEAIDLALKPRRSLKPARQRRAEKKKTKKEETAEIRAAVFERAKGLCEMCGTFATDLEHAFGRVRVPQKVSNCLAICRPCHRARTNNQPSAEHWWKRYAAHFWKYGYFDSCQMANALASKPRQVGS